MFRPLCEVRLFHEYYLTKRDGDLIFKHTSEPDIIQFLEDKLKENCPSIGNDLAYRLPESQQSLLSSYRLKLVTTYTGFKILIDVAEQELPLGITGFKPIKALPTDLPVTVIITKKNTSLDTISNSKSNSSLPSVYYLSNKELTGPKTYPFLSVQVPRQSSSKSYEQGEIASDNSDALFAFYIDKSGNEQWQPVDFQWALSEGDSMLLPRRFNYLLRNAEGISNANFSLSDKNGLLLYNIEHKIKSPRQSLLLDFNNISNIKSFELHTLQLNLDSGLSITHPVIFAEPGLLQSDTWGVISLQSIVPDTAFTLIGTDGLLKMRKQSDGTVTDIPLFQVRIPSRLSFWRYRNYKDQKIKANPTLDPYLDYDSLSGTRTSLAMRSATYVATEFKNGSNSKFISNPPSYESISVQKIGSGTNIHDQTYIDIVVPRSDLFDV